jgi:hypothetical protein
MVPKTFSPIGQPPYLFSRLAVGSFIAAIVASVPSVTLAQTGVDAASADSSRVVQEPNVSADDQGVNDPQRVNAEYQPKGLDAGDFLFFPLLDVAEFYNDNVYATETDKKGDMVTQISPEFQLRSRFPDDQLNLVGRLEETVYATHGADDHLDGTLKSDWLYNFSRMFDLSGTLEINQLYEDRGSPDDKYALYPIRTRNIVFTSKLRRHLGHLTLSGEVDAARREFANVPRLDSNVPLINTDRDRVESSVIGRAEYELFPGYAAVAQASYNDVQYDHQFDQYGYQRSGDGYRGEAGVGVDLTQVIRGDFLVGYLHQHIDDNRLPGVNGMALSAVFNWTPSRMTLIVPSFQRTLFETTLPGASQDVRTGGGVLIRHELERNIVLTASGYVYRDEYKGIGRTDWYYDTRVRAIWALAPEYYVGGEIGYRKRNSNLDTDSYNETVVLLRFGLRV